MTKVDKFSSVTELAGEMVTQEQVERICHRYIWAGQYCKDKDVVEAGCGAGQGLEYLQRHSKSLAAGDYSKSILEIAKNSCPNNVDLKEFDAQEMPYENHTKDIIVLFEAIYYIPDAARFIAECKRVLRNNGMVLIATANKDLYDFNPSPYSYKYYGVRELTELFSDAGFNVELFGYMDTSKVTLRQRILRPIKKIVITLNLMPKTMAGKKLFKRIVFGKLVRMPTKISESMIDYLQPDRINNNMHKNVSHKVLYCAARLNS